MDYARVTLHRIMRLWSIHPGYLDTKGLVALWRETLLAQKVLQGKTAGYRHHPQLHRFRESRNPDHAIASYLEAVHAESVRRGFLFDSKKIGAGRIRKKLEVTDSQLQFEYEHLMKKLRIRDRGRYRELLKVNIVESHPLFLIRHGPVAEWEAR